MRTTPSHRVRLAGAAALVCCVVADPARAADEPGANFRDSQLFRIEFDNDTFVGSDDAFSAGWSIQVHSQLLDEWTPGFAGWIGRFPTLKDDGEGGRIVRWSWGVTQMIMTPEDGSNPDPQPEDLPWAGIVGGYVSWSAYDNRRLAALQAYLGCMGPCSQAEDVQIFVHDDMGLGDIPQGWSNQLDDEVLFNLNYEYRRKLWLGGAKYETSRWGRDLSVGAQVGVGSFATYAAAWIEYRFGWDIPRGFTKFADPPAFGIALDPIYLPPNEPPTVQRSWRPYFNVVARRFSIDEFAPLEGGETENGGYHPPVDASAGEHQIILGMHFAKIPLAFHLTYYRYLEQNDVTGSELDWINLSFERRF